MKDPREFEDFETRAVRGQMERTYQKEHSTPLFMTSSYLFDDAEEARALFANEREGNIYSRYSNPNTDELISKLCDMEGTEDGVAVASGMAAMFAVFGAFLDAGDHLVACRSVFGSTHQVITQILPRWKISHTYVNVDAPQDWEKALKPNSKVLFLETPTNPGLDLIDLEWAGKFAQEHNLILVVDNCFATPYLQQPAKWGAQLVCHSTTKFLDGQGRTVGGAILGTKELMEKIRFFTRQTGPSLSPFNAWILSKSLETLAVRMDRHCATALDAARFLEAHPEVEWVKYPFLPSHPAYKTAMKQMSQGGGVVTFGIKGGLERGRKFLDSLELFSLSANLGDSRSIATHPASTTHSKLTPEQRSEAGIPDNLIRISLGLESWGDIRRDLDGAFKSSL